MRHLTELVVSQQLTPERKVQLQGETEWHEARTIPELFAEEVTPNLVAEGLPHENGHVLGEGVAPAPTGPLSDKGIGVRANFSLTLGDFQILRKLGSGGMGAVYLAQQRSLDRPVALKVLSDAHAGKSAFVNRFHREVAILASLGHPNIVKFLGAGEERGIPFFAMEYIEGFSTANLVKRHGKLAVGDALHILRKAALAMNYAATHKVVHRDIKPENLLITRLGEVKLADLGLAKSLEEADLDLTDTGTGLGSPKYMAPEQSRDAKHVDHRADIYALGGVLYYLLTAEEPFKGVSAMEMLLAKETKAFRPARKLNEHVPPRLDLMIDKMLAKEPKHRYQRYADLLHDLDTLGLTHDRLSFNPTEIIPIEQLLPLHELVEILLIDDDLDDVRLAKQALEENQIHSNLVVVKDGAEARAFLRREGKFLLAPPPNLIIFGSSVNPCDTLLTLEEVKLNESLRTIPLVVLATSDETVKFLAAVGYKVRVVVNMPDDPTQFDSFFKSIQGLCLTVLELKVAP